MSLLVNIPNRPLDKLIQRLEEHVPATEIRVHGDDFDKDEIEFALVWKHEAGSLTGYKNLKGISSFGAGVDSILSDPHLPDVDIARIIDPDLAHNMAMYVVTQIQHHRLRLNQFQTQQKQLVWKPKSPQRKKRIGILGLGELGAVAATWLNNMGFEVSGWSNSKKYIENVASYTDLNGLDEMLQQSDYLVNLLPLTASTKNILNQDVFQKLPQGAVVINVARGEHVVDDALIEALDRGHLDFAYLDVFRQEPLPQEHPFWRHPKIQITPHVSAVTNVETAVNQIVENYRRVKSQRPLINTINRQLGY